jgi:hypothetical protein
MFMVITHDIKCPYCNKVIIHGNNGIEFNEISNININGTIFPTTHDKNSGIFTIDYPHKLK